MGTGTHCVAVFCLGYMGSRKCRRLSSPAVSWEGSCAEWDIFRPHFSILNLCYLRKLSKCFQFPIWHVHAFTHSTGFPANMCLHLKCSAAASTRVRSVLTCLLHLTLFEKMLLIESGAEERARAPARLWVSLLLQHSVRPQERY